MIEQKHKRSDETSTTHMLQIIEVLSVPFSCCSFDEIMTKMADAIDRRESSHAISITNTESTYLALRTPDHLKFIKRAAFSCCDGVGVVIAGKLLGYDITRLHGPDLMLSCCEYGIERKWRHFFYGGKEGVPELLSRNLTEQFPGLITAGTYSPPFRTLTDEEDEKIIKCIRECKPHILWVGLGLLKQEQWITDHVDRLNVPWMIGVGAAFDFYAGTIKRAPKVFQRLGLEWLYRLAFEPRMAIRNFRSFMLFWDVIKELAKNNVMKRRKND
jgi:N-acetylglucosaminyldiphosphoundecaprenol N-acetyl-beta-D-mannosaminyltransferase